MYDDIRLHVARSYTSSADSTFYLLSSFTLSNHLLLGLHIFLLPCISIALLHTLAFHANDTRLIATSVPLSRISAPPQSRRFSHLYVDDFGPLLLPSQGFSHLLTVVDLFTRRPEAMPVTNTSALSLACALLQNSVSRFGTQEHITSDRGSQFTSTLWSQLSILRYWELNFITIHPTIHRQMEW